MAKKLFKKPKYLKPEINEAKYWAHIVVIVLVIEILAFFLLSGLSAAFGQPINLADVILSPFTLFLFVAIPIGDIIAHTLLKLN